MEAVEGFLLVLARAVRQVHAYPVSSQICVDAVRAVCSHLAQMEGPDEICVSVTPDALLLHEQPLGDAVFVRQELARRLRRARVAEFTVQRDATARDLTRFCVNLIRAGESTDRTVSLASLMMEDGVEAVGVLVTARRELLQIAPTAPTQRDLVAHERRRRDDALAGGARTAHLFPPHRGWIRLDPAEVYDAVTLADLAILVDDPNELAAMLHRLVHDDHPDAISRSALEHRFGDIASLFAGLEPRLSHVRFGKLASAVLALDAGPRHKLLKDSILPAVFDGRPESLVLLAFPDPDLAASLCLLLDAKSEGPAIALTALDALKIGSERRSAILRLMDELAIARIDPAIFLDATSSNELDQQARRLTKIEATERRSFAELSGFDFRLDEEGLANLTSVRGGILESNSTAVEFACLVNLLSLQPNPEIAARLINGAMKRAAQLTAAADWLELAAGLERLGLVTGSLRERRPEVAEVIQSALAGLATPDFAATLLSKPGNGVDSQAVALRIVDALGPAIAPSLLALLDTDAATSLVALMCERAALFAPALADSASSVPRRARPHVARVLGLAGAGYEGAVASMVDPDDERSSREVLRALSRIGTPRAADAVRLLARDARGWLASATVESLLHFPPESSGIAIRDLLAHRPFVLAHPAAATRLIARAAQVRPALFEPVLRDLLPLRFRFWNAQQVKVARCAEALLQR
jgi:hypothetical protein